MAGKEYRVALVVDPNFGDRLAPLANKTHVWVYGSSDDRRVAQTIWAAKPGHSLESGVTAFDFRPDETPEQICLGIVNTIDLHHGDRSHDPPFGRRNSMLGAGGHLDAAGEYVRGERGEFALAGTLRVSRGGAT